MNKIKTTDGVIGKVFVSAATLLISVVPIYAQVWDLKNDWSDTNNPNGVWKYTDGAGNLLGSNYGIPIGDGEVAQALWGQPSANQNWFKSSIAEVGWQAGDIITSIAGLAYGFGPGSSAVSWTSPTNGFVNISGDAWYAFFVTSGIDWRENDWWIATNGTVFTQSGQRFGDTTGYYRSNPFLFANGTGGASVLQNIPVQQGDIITLYITLDGSDYQGWDSAAGVDFTITLTPPVMVTAPPVSQIVSVGTTASFSVVASGGVGALSYQWQYNGTNISGATNSILTLTNVSLQQAGIYQVAIGSGLAGTVTPAATLTVTDQKLYFGLTISGIVGQNYLIQYKTNANDSSWTTLTNFILPSSPFIVFDAGSPARFYRYVLVQ